MNPQDTMGFTAAMLARLPGLGPDGISMTKTQMFFFFWLNKNIYLHFTKITLPKILEGIGHDPEKIDCDSTLHAGPQLYVVRRTPIDAPAMLIKSGCC